MAEIWKPDSVKPDQMDPTECRCVPYGLPHSLENPSESLYTDGKKYG